MRKISPKKYAVSLYESTVGLSESEISTRLSSFVKLLAEHKKLSQADKIIKAYRHYANEQEGVVEVTATTIAPLEGTAKKMIVSNLEKILSQKIVLHEIIDKKILGGIILQYDDVVLDGSAVDKLEQLKDKLNN